MKLKLAFLLAAFCTCYSVYGQSDALPEVDSNYEIYLNDGIKTGARNLVSVSALNMIGGYFDVRYRRRLTRQFSVEGGYSVRMFKGIDLVERKIMPDRIFDIMEEVTESGKGSGYSYGLRFNPFRKAITDKYFVGLDHRLRKETYSEFQYLRRDICVTALSNVIYKGNLGLGAGYGIGARLTSLRYNEGSNKADINEGRFFYQFCFNVGYYF